MLCFVVDVVHGGIRGPLALELQLISIFMKEGGKLDDLR